MSSVSRVIVTVVASTLPPHSRHRYCHWLLVFCCSRGASLLCGSNVSAWCCASPRVLLCAPVCQPRVPAQVADVFGVQALSLSAAGLIRMPCLAFEVPFAVAGSSLNTQSDLATFMPK